MNWLCSYLLKYQMRLLTPHSVTMYPLMKQVMAIAHPLLLAEVFLKMCFFYRPWLYSPVSAWSCSTHARYDCTVTVLLSCRELQFPSIYVNDGRIGTGPKSELYADRLCGLYWWRNLRQMCCPWAVMYNAHLGFTLLGSRIFKPVMLEVLAV